ncbi:MAG: DUF3108 domain-containing protein [Nitrospira sp.]|nr:DUF3108 domain-containing protein [Nitrospira sp.]
MSWLSRPIFLPARIGPILCLLAAVLAGPLSPAGSVGGGRPSSISSASASLPFIDGERLAYDVTWLGLRAGIATMVVQDSVDDRGRPQLMLSMTAVRPHGDEVLSVDNRGLSQVDLESFLPRHMTFARRGKRFNDFDYTFRHSEGLVTAVKDGKTDELAIPPDVQDAMSCLYYVRKVLPFVREPHWP